mmetsp:Transcript_88146/g.224388  ORF Transcript_88146/g.224388 Transcript_88146/m.224388 type:complete len:321 (+) Transcript_88146:77-1039(+)
MGLIVTHENPVVADALADPLLPAAWFDIVATAEDTGAPELAALLPNARGPDWWLPPQNGPRRVRWRPLRMLMQRLLDRLILDVVRLRFPAFPMRLDDFQGWRVAGLVSQLRRRAFVALAFVLLTILVAVVLLGQGTITWIRDGQACEGPLRVWLLGFLVLQFACPSLTLLLFSWSLGALLLLNSPPTCGAVSGFLAEVVELQIAQAFFLLIAAVIVMSAQPIVQMLGEAFVNNRTDPAVLRDLLAHTAVVSGADVDAEQECVICLSREEEEGIYWRKLACGHHFHGPCLSEWLKRAGHCPCCRLDVRRTVLTPDLEGMQV